MLKIYIYEHDNMIMMMKYGLENWWGWGGGKIVKIQGVISKSKHNKQTKKAYNRITNHEILCFYST